MQVKSKLSSSKRPSAAFILATSYCQRCVPETQKDRGLDPNAGTSDKSGKKKKKIKDITNFKKD